MSGAVVLCVLLQSAILGMHNITQRAMVVNGTIQPRPMMYIALTYDHRLIDGREVSTCWVQSVAPQVVLSKSGYCVSSKGPPTVPATHATSAAYANAAHYVEVHM